MPGFSATWIAAARAIWLALPFTKLVNVNAVIEAVLVAAAAARGAARPGIGSGTTISVSAGFSSSTRFTIRRLAGDALDARFDAVDSRFERTQRSTWWLGASSTQLRRRWRSARSGLIQVSNCCAGSSFLSSAASDGQSESMGSKRGLRGIESGTERCRNFTRIRTHLSTAAQRPLNTWRNGAGVDESAIISGFFPRPTAGSSRSSP